jgi:DNA-binding transcriptional LysR family regulator
MFDLSHLRCFVALAEELHFGRAAARLNMTQPPLTRQLQQLEHIIGTELMERSSRVVRLTTAGKAFLVDARAILRAAEEAMVTARRAALGEGGVITLGFIPATSYSLLPRLVSFLADEMPQVQFVLKEMVSANQAEALGTGGIDAGILRLPIDLRGLEAVTISHEPFVVAVPSSHALASSGVLAVTDLDRQPLIMYAPTESRYHHDLVSSIFRAAGITPNFVQFAREIHTMLALVGAGIGVALVPAAAGTLGFANVTLKQIALYPTVFSELTLVWRKASDNPALRLFARQALPRFLRTLPRTD